MNCKRWGQSSKVDCSEFIKLLWNNTLHFQWNDGNDYFWFHFSAFNFLPCSPFIEENSTAAAANVLLSSSASFVWILCQHVTQYQTLTENVFPPELKHRFSWIQQCCGYDDNYKIWKITPWFIRQRTFIKSTTYSWWPLHVTHTQAGWTEWQNALKTTTKQSDFTCMSVWQRDGACPAVRVTLLISADSPEKKKIHTNTQRKSRRMQTHKHTAVRQLNRRSEVDTNLQH